MRGAGQRGGGGGCSVAVQPLRVLPLCSAAISATAADFATSREEVGPEGWNELEGGSYAFRYQDTEGEGGGGEGRWRG